MAEVQQSEDVIAVARSLGVDIDKAVSFDAQKPLEKVAAQLRGDSVTFSGEDAEFGGFFSKISPFRKVKKATIKQLKAKATTPQQKALIDQLAKAPMHVDVKGSVKGLAKGIATAGAVASFVVPGVGPLVGGSALAAMQAADKLLGDPNIKNAAKLVSNTKALAAIGDGPARRGAAVLGAVAQIRQKKGAIPGQAVIPAIPPPAVASAASARPPAKVVPPPAVDSKHYVQAVPRATVKSLAVQAAANTKKKGILIRIKEWLVG